MHNPVDSILSSPTSVAGDARVLARAALHAVAYSDVFDYPLSAREIHRFLVGVRVPFGDLERTLRSSALAPQHLSAIDGYFTLRGREAIVETRLERERRSLLLWPHALNYGARIANVPFVRMVAVTGDLAVNNVRDGSDIDFLIVTRPGRLWLSRLMIIAVVRLAALRGVTVCPNFIISENALMINDRNIYTAHELVQMVCLSGWRTYIRMRRVNDWVREYLPNAVIEDVPRDDSTPGLVYSMLEAILASGPAERLECWEMRRKVRKFSREGLDNPEARFSKDWCKGHFDGHARSTLDAYKGRLNGSIGNRE